MKNRYKLFFLLVVLMMVTGCTFEYNIKIMFNGKVNESVNLFDGKTIVKYKKDFLSYADKNLKLFNIDFDEKSAVYEI